MSKGISFCLIIVGLINIVPVLGVLSVENLEEAYGIALASNDLAILMRHRALLFGILGGFVLYSAFTQAFQTAAMIMAGVSMIGFAVLVNSVEGVNESINKVLLIDYAGIGFWVLAVCLKLLSAKNSQTS
ncbi:phosphopantetheine adenylyltransferase [Pseudoteredinibacter isoporae]|uniref:Putative tellurium resistance membrane protein TerC n=1 Tax=Pseudoteredinibacter isoporae TaxID=570281 RepID=A0A7X0JS36_9GAMM|nr:phosphopantetheine adenylyltransferase [Pseudoteredinibacter isoporae]MBB6521263.1 putative tellurium resistance membrane protein TerC [Pseudoteredinibacter isoporae]NHO86821.1 phosphopantetheine adenylyltransferase [Pseudoteredinibacter isoporae]NIB24727.1 phosphopantetheine adenylyltransferase [Pseudoteredinibacter isoporae]